MLNTDTINIIEQASVKQAIELLGCMPSNGGTESNGSSISTILRNLHTEFQKSYNSSQSYQQGKVSPSSYPLQLLMLFDFLVIAILSRMKWNYNVLLIYISVMF